MGPALSSSSSIGAAVARPFAAAPATHGAAWVLPSAVAPTYDPNLKCSKSAKLRDVQGDAVAATPTTGPKVVAHVCHTIGGWGAGFVLSITKTWGNEPSKKYKGWHKEGQSGYFDSGSAQTGQLSNEVSVANIIGQEGVGKEPTNLQ